MAQSGAVGFGPSWVGHVGSTGAPPSPRVLPRPAPPPRPSRATAGDAVRNNTLGSAPETPPIGKGCEYPHAWDSPSSTASSAYFSYSSTSSASPPPSAVSPLPPCSATAPYQPCVGREGWNKSGDSPCATASQRTASPSAAKKPMPAPRSGVKAERLDAEAPIPEDAPRRDAGSLDEEIPTPETICDDEKEGKEKFSRRPSEGTGTSVIRRRATVEVRSVAVQTPSALMGNAFDSRATYPRAKCQSHHHWRANGEAITRSMDGEDGQPTSLLADPPKKKTSAPACEWHCSFVGGEGSQEDTAVAATVEPKADETVVVGHSRDVPSSPRRCSEPSVDRKGDDAEDVAAADNHHPGEEDVGRKGRGGSLEETVAKASVSHQRVSSRAELCSSPQVAYSDPPRISFPAEKMSATPAATSAVKNWPNHGGQTPVNCQPSSECQPSVENLTPVSNRIPEKPQKSVSSRIPENQQTSVSSRDPENPQTSVSSQHPSVTGASQSYPPSPRKPATPPTPSRRQPSPQQSPKLLQRQSEPTFSTVRSSSFKLSQSPTPVRLQAASSTPKASTLPANLHHQSPLNHWLSELRSSKDAVEDEEGGVTMEDKGGSEKRPPEEEVVELRGRGPCEKALNRSRRGSGGEISIYEDACSCLNGEWCCGGDEEQKGYDSQGRAADAPKVGGYKGIWGIDGAALDGGEGVSIRGGLRTRGEGITSRLSALGLKDDTKSGGGAERNKEEPEKSVNVVPLAYCRRTISEGMNIMGKGKLCREMEAKDSEPVPKKEGGVKEEPKSNGVPRKTSSNVYSSKANNVASKIEKEEGTNVTPKPPMNGKPPSGSPNAVSAQRSEGHVIRSFPEDDDDWPRRSKFTEDEMPCDDGDGLIILPETPEGHRSRISQSDSFRSTTSSESKLSSASATSSSQEIPTTGGYYNNNASSSSTSAKSSSCDNVSLSSSGGEVSLQQRPGNIPPRVKPPRKNLKPKESRKDEENSGDVTSNTAPSVDCESGAGERDGTSSRVALEDIPKEITVTHEEIRAPAVSKSLPEGIKSTFKTPASSSEEISSVVRREEPKSGSGDKSSSREKGLSDKRYTVGCEKDLSGGKPGEGVVPWEAGRGRKVACPVPPASPRLPPARPGRDKPSVASSSGGGCGSELSLESPRRGDDEEEQVEDEEEFEGEEECEDEVDWKGVYVSGRRKGSYSSDIEAWKRGLSGWCSVEDEEEFLESTKFDPEESSMYVGCGSPERSADEWYSSNDMEGRVYFFEENSNESSWTLPEVAVVSQPQTPPPIVVSGSPAGSDSFISGRSSGGEEGTNGTKEERDGSSHSIGGGSLVGVSRDDMVAMPLVKMKMDQWEKGGRLIQLRDSGALEKDLRVGGRSSRAAKTRSMVIGDQGVGEVKIPLPAKISSAKDWPQLWDGNMYIIREGTLNKTKITENKKRVRKNWAPSHVVLTELFLLFFKDAKTFASLKAGSMGGNISPGDSGAMPELCVDLNGALVDREDQLSSRRNVFRVSTVLGLQVLCQDDNAQNAEAWFQDVSKAASKLPSGFDGSPRQQNPVEMRNFLEPNSPDEQKKFPRIGRSKSVKVKKDASMEDLSSGNSTERQVKIKARLKKFFHRRPTMETLVKKGIWKDEPAFGSYLEQVSGEGIPRIPLFVQRCVAAIESKPENMKADGLYRASGNLSQVQKIRLQVDQNNLSVVDMEEDVHVLTGALKLFFRELKEPLIPYALFNRALTASTNPNKKEQLHEFKEIVKILPVANYDTLKYLLQHLLRVTSYQEFNRMHIANLAIVFGPTLMWPKQESLNMALDLMQQNLVIECLLQEFDTIFSTGR